MVRRVGQILREELLSIRAGEVGDEVVLHGNARSIGAA